MELSDTTLTQSEKYMDIVLAYASEYALKLAAALIIFIIGKWVVHKIQMGIVALMRKNSIDETLISFVQSVVYILLIIVVILSALSTLGVETTSFVAMLGAAGLAIGLALQGTLGNVGSGMMLISFRPFKVGDFITAAGETGEVAGISIFATTLHTRDNKVITIPNGAITSGNITNFSAREIRRVDMTFGISYGDDLKKAKQILEDIIGSDERVLAEPAPLVAVSELGDSSVNFIFRPWVKSEEYWDVYFSMNEKVKLTFDKEGITIPFPQMDIHVSKGEA